MECRSPLEFGLRGRGVRVGGGGNPYVTHFDWNDLKIVLIVLERGGNTKEEDKGGDGEVKQ